MPSWIKATTGRIVNSAHLTDIGVEGNQLIGYQAVPAGNVDSLDLCMAPLKCTIALQGYETREAAERAIDQLLHCLGKHFPVIWPHQYDGREISFGKDD